MRSRLGLLCLLLLNACATIIEGTSQEINVVTDPPGAECGLYRDNQRIGTISNTPGSVLIKKSNHDISMLCVKRGYQNVSLLNRSDAAGWVAGNILFGGIIGVVIDSASGSGNKYDGTVKFTMQPIGADSMDDPGMLPVNFAMPPPSPTPLPQGGVDPQTLRAR